MFTFVRFHRHTPSGAVYYRVSRKKGSFWTTLFRPAANGRARAEQTLAFLQLQGRLKSRGIHVHVTEGRFPAPPNA